MHRDAAMIALHACAGGFALIAALLWPRAGEAALLVPVGGQDLAGVIAFATREGAPLLELDSASGRVIVLLDETNGSLRALAAGIVPLAASARGCDQPKTRSA